MAVATKEDPPDIALAGIPAEVLDEKLKLDARLEESNPFADTFDGRALHEQKFKAEYYRLLKNEQDAVGRAYDEVKRRPVGDKNDPLVVLKPLEN